MNVPFLDLKAHLSPLHGELREALMRVVTSGRFIMGPEVEGLEEEIAQYVGVRHAIGVSSGTDALLVSLMALEVGPGDIVVTTPYSFFATAGVIARLNATPAFVDIEPDTYTMNPELLSDYFKRHPSRERIKAVIPIHLYGQCADMDPLCEAAERYGIPVIEDAAQALGATYPSHGGVKKAGAMGAAGCFSFFPSKNLGGLGDGGMVVTGSDELADRIRRLRNHGARPKYYHALVGGNFRLDAIQAAALRILFPHLQRWTAQRRENAARYDAQLAPAPLRTPAARYGRNHHVYNQYVVFVPQDRDGLREFLRQRKIATEVYYPLPFHLQACFKRLGYREGDFPASEEAARHTLALPIYPELPAEHQHHIIEAIGEFYG